MVRDDDKIKINDGKSKEKPLERVKQKDNDLEISNVTRTDEILDDINKRPFMNLILRYVGAIIIVLIAFWLYFVMTDVFGPGLPTYILFYPAIIVIAIMAGFRPGVLATIISVSLAIIWILPPQGQIALDSVVNEVGAVLFTTFGIAISGVSELYRRNRKKAAAYDKEKALRKSLREKEFLANILEHASQPFAIGYPDGRLGLFNLAYEELTGYTKEELHTIDWSTILTPLKWMEMEKQKLDELIKTTQPVRYEKEYIRKDGSIVPIELLVSINLDKDGNPEYYYSFITDITERKKAENALKLSEQRISDMIESISDYIYSLDKNWNFIYVNETSAKDVGYKSSELIGKNIWKAVNKLAGTKFEKEFREAMNKREIRQFEWQTLYTESYREFTIYPSDEGITVYGKDITERKKAQDEIISEKNRLQTILETSPTAIIIIELDGQISYINKRAEQIYGLDISGLDLTSAISKVKAKKVDGSEYPVGEGPSARALKGQLVHNEEMILEQPDGTVIPILGSAAPIFNAYGKVTAAVAIFEDITERKQEEERKQELLETEQQLSEELTATNEELQATTEELRTSNEELINARNNLTELVVKLKTSNKELEQFAHVASHDLQEPLRMVGSFTQLLERRYKNQLDEDADDYIGFIVEGAQRMKSLIDDLLAFSKLNTEPCKYEPILIEIALDDVLFNLKSSIEENNALITYDSLPTVMGDLSQIRQVFQNLISNAIKFHGDEQPEIHISAKEFEREWLFSVSDNGIGINLNHQEQIFSIFKRLHTRNDYEGTGIGLAICKSIVERHGGKIWVESRENEGSTFYFNMSKSDLDIKRARRRI